MHRQLFDLFHEKAKVEAQIRRIRVITIRKTLAERTDTADMKSRGLSETIAEVENMLQSVAYDHARFDGLLDDLEASLFDN